MASLLDLVRRQAPMTADIPETVKKRLGRGRSSMMTDAAKRRLCVRFERGDTYWFIDGKQQLQFQSTVTNPNGSGKPPHRVRNKYNFIRPVVTAKVSAATQQVPGFEVVPTTTEEPRVAAARLAERVALYGYDKWMLKGVAVRANYNAIGGGGEGFALPYFDPNVGPYVEVTDPETGETRMVGQGEIKVIVLNGNEAYWEPGSEFMESRWHAVERARVVEDIEEMPGFFGDKLAADAATSDIPTDTPKDNMVMVTEYFERPCPKYPDGRHLVIANGRQVVPERPYPLRKPDGSVIDEPVLHRLAWDLDGGAHRDFGLTWQMIDAQRTAQDARNKAVEWKNRCLMPQWKAPVNSLTSRPTDEPGAVMYYQGMQAPEQETPQPIPDSLFQIADVAKQDLYEIGFAQQIQANPNVAARTVQAVLEQSQLQWAAYLNAQADWWSRLMRHCLLLVTCHYSEPRMLEFKGRDGWEHISDFEGAQLMDEVDVRVSAHSLVAVTRDGVRDQLNWLAQTFPGWLQPQDALASLQSGSLDRLTQSYWLDVARANTVIQKIRDGTVMDMPSRGSSDPVTGQPQIDPQTGQSLEIPGYMPSDQDNLEIWEKVFADWMKTDDYANQAPPAQAVAQQVWDGIQRLKAAKAQRAAAQQNAMAEQLGMQNAARPATPKPLPSLPSPNGQG